jgi:hypothetical protein
MRRNQKRENTSELANLRHYDYKNYDILKKKQSKFEPEDRHCLDYQCEKFNLDIGMNVDSRIKGRYCQSAVQHQVQFASLCEHVFSQIQRTHQ